MKRILWGSLVTAALVLAVGCASRSDVAKPQTQDNFGVRMAKMNLWREAMFRFRRAVEINPSDAMAHNNLAVAYEANGDFDQARKEYLEALKLDRGNAYIQKNYSRYVEFLSRNKKRAAPKTTAATSPAAPPAPPLTQPPEPAPPLPTPAEPVRPLIPPPQPAPPQPAPPSTPPPGGVR